VEVDREKDKEVQGEAEGKQEEVREGGGGQYSQEAGLGRNLAMTSRRTPRP
jgi:hypothetical protein